MKRATTLFAVLAEEVINRLQANAWFESMLAPLNKRKKMSDEIKTKIALKCCQTCKFKEYLEYRKDAIKCLKRSIINQGASFLVCDLYEQIIY